MSSSDPSREAELLALQEELLALLPDDLSGCVAVGVYGDGDVAAAECTGSLTEPMLSGAAFWRYPDPSTLRSVFAADVGGIPTLSEGADCTTGQGVSVWSSLSGTGRLACYVRGDSATIWWFDEAVLVEGRVESPGGTQSDLARLYNWWAEHIGQEV